MVVLPIAHLLILIVLLRRKMGWRLAGAWASLVWGIEVVALTELLSLARLLEAGIVAGAWFLATALLAGWAWHKKLWPRPRDMRLALPAGVFNRAMIGAIAVLVGVSFVVAVIAPPNNYDSMTYHMSRVAHWAHNRSVVHYPTHILRQLHQNPFAEYMILQLYLLADGDRFANTVQWAAWLGSILAGSLVAKELGAAARGQIWTAVFIATLPMAVLQATNTQNDLILGFALVLLALFVARILRAGGGGAIRCCMAWMCLEAPLRPGWRS